MENRELVSQTTMLLRRMEAGDTGASEDLYSLLYQRLREIARGVLGVGGAGDTLQPTVLVHEVWLRLGVNEPLRAESRRHFLSIAARAMRCVVVDHARSRTAEKRTPGQQRIPIDAALDALEADRTVDPLVLDELLERLRERDARLADVVELRFFGGLTEPETAEALDLTPRQTQHAWKLARAWLALELQQQEDGES